MSVGFKAPARARTARGQYRPRASVPNNTSSTCKVTLHTTSRVNSVPGLGHNVRRYSATTEVSTTNTQGKIDGYVVGRSGSNLTKHAALFNENLTKGGLERVLKQDYHYTDKEKSKKYHRTFFLPVASEATTINNDDVSRVSVVTLDRENDEDSARKAAGKGAKDMQGLGAKVVAIEPFGFPAAAAEGAMLATYAYSELLTKKKDVPTFVPFQFSKEEEQQWEIGKINGASQIFCRDLANAPSNVLTPTEFVNRVRNEYKRHNLNEVRIEERDKKWAEGKKMGCFLGVAQGSPEPLKFLEIHYSHPEAANQKPIILVGKGITFDTGGISIKPSGGMSEMKGDMGGAASVVSSLLAVARRKVPLNVITLTPLCENMPSGTAIKPGDVLRAVNGKTVEVDNTDAEGRLILADALCYAQEFNPRLIIDVATLTGAIDVALGKFASGVFANSSDYFNLLERVSRKTGERMWRMPLWDGYKDQLKSNTADILNCSLTRSAGSCTAAIFLNEFVPKQTPWMHIDIAGVMRTKESTPYVPSGMTGKPVRTLIEFLVSLTSSNHSSFQLDQTQ